MAEPFRILVTGSRGWNDAATLAAHLGHAACEAHLQRRIPVIVHGACPKGADQIADEVARQHGNQVERHPADWGRHGKKRAGFIRNAEMVALGADLCLAFVLPCVLSSCRKKKPHDTHGTAHCVALARKAGIPVKEVRGDQGTACLA